MSWRMVNGKAIQIRDSPTISSSGKLHWNVRDILYKDCPEAPFCPGDCQRCPDSQADVKGKQDAN